MPLKKEALSASVKISNVTAILGWTIGSLAEGYTVVHGGTDSVGSAEEEGALTGDTGPLLVLYSLLFTVHKME